MKMTQQVANLESHTRTQPRCVPFPLESDVTLESKTGPLKHKGLKPLSLRFSYSAFPRWNLNSIPVVRKHPDPLQAATVPRKDPRLQLFATRHLFLGI